MLVLISRGAKVLYCQCPMQRLSAYFCGVIPYREEVRYLCIILLKICGAFWRQLYGALGRCCAVQKCASGHCIVRGTSCSNNREQEHLGILFSYHHMKRELSPVTHVYHWYTEMLITLPWCMMTALTGNRLSLLFWRG